MNRLIVYAAYKRLQSEELDMRPNTQEMGKRRRKRSGSRSVDDWWNSLSPAERRDYMRKHPCSRKGRHGKGVPPKGPSGRLKKIKRFANKVGKTYRRGKDMFDKGKDLYDRYGRYVLPLIV